MATEAFTIAKRPGWGASVTVNIECDPLASYGVKLGLAVRVGHATGANLTGANLTMANLTRADLAGADLTGANLTMANLTGADLTGADLTGAYLAGADLTRADLTRADLAGADLAGAYLTGADLTGAYLAGAEIRDETVTRIVGQAVRLTPGDQYTFTAFEMGAGGVKVLAGCRWFALDEYRLHVAAEYADTDKAADTLEILDYLERRAVRVGAIKPDEPAPKKPRTKAKPALATQDPDLRGGR